MRKYGHFGSCNLSIWILVQYKNQVQDVDKLYLLMTGGLQRVVLDFILPICNLPHLHVHLKQQQHILHV